nr:oligosaccharide flippase family protein [Methylonatrum kenyense]
MRKEISFHRGRNDPGRVDLVIGTVFGANALYAAAAGVLLLGAAAWMAAAGHRQIYVDFVIFLALHIALDKFRTFYSVLVVAEKKGFVLGKSRIMHDFLAAGLGVLLVYFMSLRGLLIGLLLAQAVTCAYLYLAVRTLPRLRFSPGVLWPLVRIGLPVMLTGLGFLLLKSVDQIIIAARLPREMLGFFGLAVLVSSLIYMALSDVFGAIFFPRLMEKAGQSDDVRELRDYLVRPTLLVAYLMPYLVGAAFLLVHLPILYALPEYVPAITVTRILILGAFFYCVAVMPLMLCVALNRERSMLLLTLGAVALNAVLSYGLISLGYGIGGVALGTAATHLAFSVVIIFHVLRAMQQSIGEVWRFLADVYAPFAFACLLLLLLEFLPGGASGDVLADFSITTLKLLTFLVFFTLVPWRARGRLGLTKLVKGILRRQAD